jgi:hypothetical protein
MNTSSAIVVSGKVASITALMLEGTYCIAQNSGPYVRTNIRKPITARLRHSMLEGRACPRSRMKPYSNRPAMRKRAPAVKKGGISSTAMRMARKVPPHRQ